VLELIMERFAGVWKYRSVIGAPANCRRPISVVRQVRRRLHELRLWLPIASTVDEREGDADEEDLPAVGSVLAKTAAGKPAWQLKREHGDRCEQERRRLRGHRQAV